MLLNTNIWASNLVTAGTAREHEGRFDYLWPLPGIVALGFQPDEKQTYDALVTYMGDSLAADLNRHVPDMVIVDVSPYKRALPASYDILGFFSQDPHFVKAWSQYTLAETINACTQSVKTTCAYNIYYRK